MEPDGRISLRGAVTDEDGVFASGGLHLFRRVWRPRSQRRATMVMVHGLQDHGGRYGSLAREMNDVGVVVHNFDLRGHGKSEGRPTFTPSFEDYLRDLERFIKIVEEKEAMPISYLFGHSMGGAIATLYTLTRLPTLRGLILSAPALKKGKDVSSFQAWSARVLSDVWPSMPTLKLNPEYFSRDPNVVHDIQTDPLIHQKGTAARTAASLLDAVGQIDRHMEDLHVPLLLLHGMGDRITDPAATKELSERAGSTDITLKLYPELFHDLLHEPERAQIRRDIRRWVESRLP